MIFKGDEKQTKLIKEISRNNNHHAKKNEREDTKQ